MNVYLSTFLWFICLLCLGLVVCACRSAYRTISRRKRSIRLRRIAERNRGYIGEAQEWQCFQCYTLMLSDYKMVVFERTQIVAVCHRCSSLQKFEHIYHEGEPDRATGESNV